MGTWKWMQSKELKKSTFIWATFVRKFVIKNRPIWSHCSSSSPPPPEIKRIRCAASSSSSVFLADNAKKSKTFYDNFLLHTHASRLTTIWPLNPVTKRTFCIFPRSLTRSTSLKKMIIKLGSIEHLDRGKMRKKCCSIETGQLFKATIPPW